MAVQIQLRRGSAAYWTAANPVLAQGELGIELDTGKFKAGNGTSTWVTLGYSSGAVSFVDFPEVDDVTVGNPNDGDFLQYNTATSKWIATTTVKTLQVVSPVPSTSPTTGGLVVTGGMGVTGDVNIAGNLNFSGTATISVSSGEFFGNEFGFNALYAGISSFTPLDQTVLQLTANTSTFAQVNFQNINSGTEASSDFVLTCDAGSQETGYIDLGINSSNYNNPLYSASGPHDGYLYVAGHNLVIGTDSTGTAVKIHVGGTLEENIVAVFNEVNTNSTSTNSGALVVAGGVGIGGNLYVAGEIVAEKLTVQYTTVTTTVIETDDIIKTSNTTASTSTNSGALVVAGGVGIGGDLYVGGIINGMIAGAGSATTATTIAGGGENQLVYQASTGTTAFKAIGNYGQVLQVINTSTGEFSWGDIDGGTY